MSISAAHRTGFTANSRTDNWWIETFAVLLGLLFFVFYLTWAAFQGDHYWHSAGTSGFGGYLSPLYSPLIYIKEGIAGAGPMNHAWIGSWPAWWPAFMPASPAFLILPFPGLFRFTCYYYRKAYYRAFAWSPPACAVGGAPQKPYKGESGLLLFQNLHRYAMYIALVFILILYYDAFLGFFRNGEFGVGVGSIVLLVNATLLAGYTLGCHSFRHVIGGRLDCYSCSASAKTSHGIWKKVSLLNGRHMNFAWTSLFWVAFTDFYIRMVSSGVWTDFNTWGM